MPSPEIVHLGPLVIRWYGLFASLATLLFFLLMTKRAAKYGFKVADTTDCLTVIVICGIIGARLEYVRRFWSESFADDWTGIFRIWEGGLVFQGGFILAAIGAWIFCRRRKLSIGNMADLMAPVVPLGHAVARLGCLLNGCCFGLPWSHGICYPATGNDVLRCQIASGYLEAGATTPLPVVPVQVMESCWCLVIAAVIYLCERKKWLTSCRFFVYLALYSLGRVGLECFRGDYGPLDGLTPAQNTSLFVILPATIAIIVFVTWRQRLRNKKDV